jgi:hypothetical protein
MTDQHGEEAPIRAAERADELLEAGDIALLPQNEFDRREVDYSLEGATRPSRTVEDVPPSTKALATRVVMRSASPFSPFWALWLSI